MNRTPNKKENINIELFEKQKIFRTNLNEIKSVCLDQASSDIWKFIKREKLENILFEKNGHSIQNKGLEQLYSIITLFYYELFKDEANRNHNTF